jgi:RNA polymerase sigma-70 factor (ECF subfamily)
MNKTRVATEMETSPIEPEDFDWIVLNHQKQIYRILLLVVRDRDEAEVLTQECFLRAFSMSGSFRGESSLATWLIRIAINLAHDHNKSQRGAFWRRLARTDGIDAMRIPDIHRSAEQALIDAELVNVIQSAVNRLPPRQRTVFLLRFIEDLPVNVISEIMELEIGTIKSHLHRAIEAVRNACVKRKN